MPPQPPQRACLVALALRSLFAGSFEAAPLTCCSSTDWSMPLSRLQETTAGRVALNHELRHVHAQRSNSRPCLSLCLGIALNPEP